MARRVTAFETAVEEPEAAAEAAARQPTGGKRRCERPRMDVHSANSSRLVPNWEVVSCHVIRVRLLDLTAALGPLGFTVPVSTRKVLSRFKCPTLPRRRARRVERRT